MSAAPSHSVAPFTERLNEAERPVEQPKDAGVANVLNLAEAATLLRCSRAHLCNVIKGKVRGIPHLPTVRIGRRVLFRRESLEHWLREVEAIGWKRAAS
jgi:excisionase family DNA binding protein